MWERFSYYGMRALLIFYLTKHWLFSDSESGVIYGAYTALVYITPVLGGYLADRWLGQRKAVLYGAILLTFGHFLMGFEGDGGQNTATLNIFWLALAFIIVGSGFLKANISVIVGQLYARTDVRRDGAYTIFYMGINLGAALGSILCGYLGETYGWAYGFGAAGFGMLLGLIVFVVFKPLLLGRGEPSDPAEAGCAGYGHQAGMAALSGWSAGGRRMLVAGAESVCGRHAAGRGRHDPDPLCTGRSDIPFRVWNLCRIAQGAAGDLCAGRGAFHYRLCVHVLWRNERNSCAQSGADRLRDLADRRGPAIDQAAQ